MATKEEQAKARRDRANRKKAEKASIDELFLKLIGSNVPEPKTKVPEKGLDKDVSDIYKQAYEHRNKLLNFFIWYTIALSVFVIAILCVQAYVRIYIPHKETLEIVPQWALYLLVVGMFGQFIGLLTIVTKKVWTFEPFFKHYQDSMKDKK